MAATNFTASKLIIAIRAGILGDVIAAIEEGADIEEPDMHGFVGLPLRTACFEGNIDIVRELLRRGAKVDADAGDGPGAPLRLAKRRGHQSVAALLLLQGAQMPSKTEATASSASTAAEVKSTPIDQGSSAPAQPIGNTIEFDNPPPDYPGQAIGTPVDFLLDTDAAPQEEIVATPLPEEQPGNIIEFTTSALSAEPIEQRPAALPPSQEEPAGNIIEFGSLPPELLTEEIEATTCYGTDTNLLTLDLMRLEEQEEEAEAPKPAPPSKKAGFWKSGS